MNIHTKLTKSQELKLQVLANGISVSENARKIWQKMFSGPMSLNEYASTSGICLATEDNVWMNAPFIETFTKAAIVNLDFIDGRFSLIWDNIVYPVKVIPVPAYHDRYYTDKGAQHRYTSLGVTHTDRCRISPIGGCAWVCTFCDLPFDFKYNKRPKEELLKVIEIAAEDKFSPARHVLISGGTPKPEDEDWIDEVYAYIAGNSPIPVDIMMPARKELDYPQKLKDWGVSMLSVNLEVFDKERAKRITPNKAKLLGVDFYLDYIEQAVKIFGVGFVQSLIVFGEAIEPIESVLKGVRALADRGCMPILSPFRPDPATPLGKMGAKPASIEEMRRVYIESVEICEKSGTGVKLGPRCIPCMHNTLTFQDESNFYVDIDGDLTLPIQ